MQKLWNINIISDLFRWKVEMHISFVLTGASGNNEETYVLSDLSSIQICPISVKHKFLFLVLDFSPKAGFRLACRSPLCRYAAWSSLAVSELQLSVATPLWLYHWATSLLSWIEFNCLRSAAVGKAAGLSIYWQDAAYRLVFPLRQVALNCNHH